MNRAALRQELVTLIYELLDAHGDTAEMARNHATDELWAAHVDYLRALQRRGREMLAQSLVEGHDAR